MASTEIRERTEKLLKRLTELPAFEKVTALIEDGKLVLEGCVESYASKHEAEAIAREAGFTDVDNCLRVYPCEPAASAQPQT